MIFVILGIIILTASFVIALLSLLREERASRGESVNGQPPLPGDSLVQQGAAGSPSESTLVPEAPKREPESHQKREPFPWEENQQPEEELWGSQHKQKLSGEVSLKDIARGEDR